MKNKTVIIILSVLAVAMYTVAAINFCTGNGFCRRFLILNTNYHEFIIN